MQAFRDLPSVDQLIRNLQGLESIPHPVIVREARRILQAQRDALSRGEPGISNLQDLLAEKLSELLRPSLRRVINATGVVLHTNLGRAPLANFNAINGSSNLEFDLATGKRGKRDVHTASLLEKLLGAPAIVVNNNAAAVYLVLRELAEGGEVLVSRGELIEIGDGFRIPDIMACSGARLREIGTTNKTRIEDYRAAINLNTRAILRVHPSNFHISGFASRPSLQELSELAREADLPVYEDLGSGCLVDLRSAGITEPLVSESLNAGVSVVSFSTDKLLGGPQSGIIAGRGDLVTRIRRNPMYRALRLDKLVIQSLETTLRVLLQQQWDQIPTLRAIFTTPDQLKKRAQQLAVLLNAVAREDNAPVGGGSTPDQMLPTWVVELNVAKPQRLLDKLRQSDPPVIARIANDAVILDLRSVAEDELDMLAASVRSALT